MDTFKKDFRGWCEKKEILHGKDEDLVPYFNERELWWCALGVNIGFEQDGKNEHFERPVLVLRKFNKHLLLVLPQTSKAK
jgi:mRNA interferase MazF